MDLPIACSLDAQGAEQRRHKWELLIGEALRSQTETPTGVRLVFSATAETERRLKDLARLERECCAFARWTITPEADDLVLRVDGEDEGVTAIHELFRSG